MSTTARVALAFLVFAGACARPGPPAAQAPIASTGPFAGWDRVRTATVTNGVTHTDAHTRAGPWAVQLLEVDRALCRPRIEARKPGPPLAARATTSQLAAGAIAAINADFFMLPGGTPVGPHVHDGVVLAGPGRRIAFHITEEGFSAGHGAIRGFARAAGDSARIAQVNRPLDGDAQHEPVRDLALHTEWLGDTLVASAAAPALRMRPLADDAGIVVSIDTVTGAGFAGMRALHAGPDALAWLRRRAPGDTVRWRVALVDGEGEIVREAVGGFPRLVAGGRNVVAEQTGIVASFGPARHPRTAVGWSDARLWWVVVDGRQADWSAGMSLDELADLFVALGATHAVNLDGGGSSAMIIGGRVVNRPSDAQGERAVGNALALTSCL